MKSHTTSDNSNEPTTDEPTTDGQLLADAPDNGDLTRFQLEICYCLFETGPSYGLAIKRDLESLYAEAVNHGRLYPNLDDLVALGLVEKSERDKRTNEYELSSDGRELVRRDAQRRHHIADGVSGDA